MTLQRSCVPILRPVTKFTSYLLVVILALFHFRTLSWYNKNGFVAVLSGSHNSSSDDITESTILTSLQYPIQTKHSNASHSKMFRLEKTDSLYHHYNLSTTPIVIEKYKLLMFTCEKIGSTVLRQLMRRMMGYEDYDAHGGGIPHVFPKNGLKYLHLYSLQDAHEMMTSDEWTRAMFVRDPKERALSAYLMWRPSALVDEQLLRKAAARQITESVKGTTSGMIGRCCKEKANGDYNFEVLCINHMSTFDGFLDLIEDPKTINLTAIGLDYYGWNNISNSNHFNTTSTYHVSSMMKYLLRHSSSCPDKHWSPITHWRMEHKFYPLLTFIGHLETAQWDIQRLLNRLHPEAWKRYGASGWGQFKNESMFESSSTVSHAKGTENYLDQFYTSEEIEKRVEHIYKDDYDNKYLELDRVSIGMAGDHYREKSKKYS